MICIGFTEEQKKAEITQYQEAHGIEKTVAISADAFPLAVPGADAVKFSDVIMYKTFYRLLQEITPKTLVILHECLRTQNRYDLAYNCIRNFLNLTTHQIVFQQLPQIDTREDFMILFDFDTRSRWKRRKFDMDLIAGEAQVCIQPMPISFERVAVPTTSKTRARYQQERDRLFRELGNRDPHIVPRNLHLIAGGDKLAWIDAQSLPLFGQDNFYVARNKRLNRANVVTYEHAEAGQEYVIVDLPHRFIDYCDFVGRTGQAKSQVLVADLKVDHWYFQRYEEWAGRVHDTYASL